MEVTQGTKSIASNGPSIESITMQQNQQQTQPNDTNNEANNTSKPLPSWYPKYKGKHIYYGNKEAFAFALDGVGRAVTFIAAGAFLSTALLKVARIEAGCETEPPPGETEIPECNKTIYGIKPSSLLTTYTLIIGVASTALLPLMGAIVDYTPHRRLVGRITSILFTILIIPQMFLRPGTLLFMCIVQLSISLIGWLQTLITYAYLPELTPDEHILNDYTKNFTITSFGSMVAFLIFILGGVSVLGYGDDAIITARIAMVVSFLISSVLLYVAWGPLFQRRKALHQLGPNRSLWTAGFVQLYNTGVNIVQNYRALKWFYMGVAFSDGALQSLATISITYMTDQLHFTATENGIAILSTLLGNIPGAVISNYVTRKFDPLISSMGALVLLIVGTGLFSTFLTGPGQQFDTYILAMVWGTGLGWKWSCDRLVASSIIPAGQDAELMGFFLFSGQCISWVPPLVYTAINEAGISQRVGIASLVVFFTMSLVCYLCLGSYADARREVGRSTSYQGSSNSSSGGGGTTTKDDWMVQQDNKDCHSQTYYGNDDEENHNDDIESRGGE